MSDKPREWFLQFFPNEREAIKPPRVIRIVEGMYESCSLVCEYVHVREVVKETKNDRS